MGYADGISDNGLTVREQACQALMGLITAMTDGGESVWRKVEEGDIDDFDNDQCPMVALDYGTEENLNNTFPCSTYKLPVIVQFRYRGQRGLDEHVVYRYYLGLLQKALLSDHNLDGSELASLTQDLSEVSNSHTIVGVEDVYPGGTLVIDMIYKTRLHNPYQKP